MLAVNEIFGPTFQGEGKNIGMPTMFLRLAGCNLHCSWCDTPYTWDWQRYDRRAESHPTPWEAVATQLQAQSLRNLVISGGEPLLQSKALLPLTTALHVDGWHIEVETAGTVQPTDWALADLYTVSPKLANSGNLLAQRYHPETLTAFAQSGKAVFKFVVEGLADFAELDQLVTTHRLHPVYIMPQGILAEQVQQTAQQVANAAIERGYYLTTRLHVLLYGNRRGV